MKLKNRLSAVQMLPIIISAILGVQILTVQHDLVVIASQDAWISLLIGSVLAFIAAITINLPLAAMYPENDLPEIIIKIFVKVFGRFALLPLMVYILLDTDLSLRIFVQALKVFLLDRTPLLFLIILVAAAVISISKRDIADIGAAIDFMFPVLFLPLVFLVLLSGPQINPLRLQPVLYKNTEGVLKGIVPAFGALIGYGSINYYMICHRPEKCL